MPTKIEWCDETINPLGYGCYGPGGTAEKPNRCAYCFAYTLAKRNLRGCKLCAEFIPHTHFEQLNKLAKWKKSKNIFVCSMADLFGEWVPDEWIDEVFNACKKAPQHNYLFLTKNPKRYSEIYRGELDYRNYMWMGVTATDTRSFAFKGQELFDSTGRIEKLHAKRFMSIEPLHEAINEKSLENIKYLDWVIIGAETGNRKDKISPKKEWIDKIVWQCKNAAEDVPVFMKDSLINIVGEENMLREFPEGLRK